MTPVPSAEAPEGYLYVVLRGERYDALDRLIEESYFLRLSAWAVAASLTVGLGFGLLMFHLLTRRLQRLSGAMDRFRRSGFSAYEPYGDAAARQHEGDEIDALGNNYDRMAERIAEQLAALERPGRAAARPDRASLTRSAHAPRSAARTPGNAVPQPEQGVGLRHRAHRA